MKVEEIRDRMLSKFPDTYDKGEGTVLWDICQAHAYEYSDIYSKLDTIKNDFFLETIKDEELFDYKLADYGENRKEAVYASGTITIEGEVGIELTKGSLVASDLIEYETLNTIVIPNEGKIDIPIRCKEAGKIGNATIGVVNKFPITIKGIYKCYNQKSIENGIDMEGMEEARERVKEKIREPKTSGNIYDYKHWAKSIEGVGNARVIPRWNGVNTVKIYITDRNNDIATETLINETFEYIDEIRPVGASISVESAKLKMVDVEIIGLKEDINANQTPEQIRLSVKETLREYINSVSLDATIVSYAKCNRAVLDTEGIGDFVELKLNANIGTIELLQDEIARFNSLIIDGETI